MSKLEHAGRQQHHVARSGDLGRSDDDVFEAPGQQLHGHGPAELALDPPSRRPVGEHVPRMAGQRATERREVLSLVLAPEQDHDRPVDAGQRAERRRDVGRLGVVDPQNAASLGHRLHPVRKGSRRAEPLRDALGIGPRDPRRQRRGERIGDVVLAQQGKLATVDQALDPTVPPEAQRPVPDERVRDRSFRALSSNAKKNRRPGATPANPATASSPAGRTQRLALVRRLEQTRLVRVVRVDVRVPVQMVRRQVRHDPDLRVERLHAGELKRAHLEHVPLRRLVEQREVGRRGREAPADVATGRGPDPRRREEVRDEERSRGLPIGPGDCNQWTRVEPNGEVGLGDPALSPCGERSEQRSVGGDSRTDHDDPGACHSLDVVSTQLDRRSSGSELGSTS